VYYGPHKQRENYYANDSRQLDYRQNTGTVPGDFGPAGHARDRIQAFVADEKARVQYEGLMAKGQALQMKQQRSEQLSGDEISAFENERETLLKNPVARGFLEAQEEMHHVHQSINQFVSKTLELGRMPTEADFESEGSCGDGCGCGHSH
jgi:cell fate (sporulation/competence/biofilm development) regulator YlbF (YheA/YmcA/DUF963 family)